MAFAGPVSSFHYEITRNFDRLTDERWEEKFWLGELPPRPDWVGEYLADVNGNMALPARKLKGSVYGGTFTDPVSVMNPMDYLLAFPNPAEQEFHLRFVLNQKSDIQADIYSLEGRYLLNVFAGILAEGEHDIPVNTESWTRGVYIVKFQTGDRIHSRKVVIK